MHLIEIDHRSQSSFHHFFLTEEQRFLLAIGLRYGGDFVFENAGDGAEVCSTGFLFWVLQFGSLSFWNPFGNILERDAEREEGMGLLQTSSGKEKYTCFSLFGTPILRGRAIRCFYALGNIEGWLGTLAATLETRGNFSHLFNHDNPWTIAQGYEPHIKGTFLEVHVYKRDWLVE